MGVGFLIGGKMSKFDGAFFYLWNESTSKWDDFTNDNIFKDSLKGALETQDLDSTRDANGVLNRNVLEHTAYTIEFTTPPCWNDKMDALWSMIRSHYLSGHKRERKLKVKFYVHEQGDYDTGEFYISTPTFNVGRVEGNKIFYNSMTINLIQY